jgi:hypothetical protein
MILTSKISFIVIYYLDKLTIIEMSNRINNNKTETKIRDSNNFHF